jgi:signal peptidase I
VTLALVLVAALLVGLGVRTFVIRSLTVSSSSMSPTLCAGDRVLVNLWDPDLADLQRDDLVALRPADSEVPVVKRLVGLPGDRVAIRDGKLFVDGEIVREPYVDRESVDSLFYGPVVVPAGRFLVLGDARETSIDSRSYGPVRSEALIGRVVLRLPLGEC